MIDWAEGHHKMKTLIKELYDAMLTDNPAVARGLCEQIIVEARLTRALIQERDNV